MHTRLLISNCQNNNSNNNIDLYKLGDPIGLARPERIGRPEANWCPSCIGKHEHNDNNVVVVVASGKFEFAHAKSISARLRRRRRWPHCSGLMDITSLIGLAQLEPPRWLVEIYKASVIDGR